MRIHKIVYLSVDIIFEIDGNPISIKKGAEKGKNKRKNSKLL